MRPSIRPPWLKQTLFLPWLLRARPQNLVPRRIATTSATNAAPVDIPKTVITPGSQHHDSLPSFIEYAKRVNLDPAKTVYVGTHYEYVAALALQRLGFSLLRVGRRFDSGIDLIGHWVLAPLREPLPVVIQCKVRAASTGPAHVRELEGSFHAIPPSWRKKSVLGLLVTTRKATKGVVEHLGSSRWPLGFIMLSEEGQVQQFLWNRAASEQGLEGVSVTVRHTPRALLPEDDQQEDDQPDGGEEKAAKKPKRADRFKNSGTIKDIQLTWMGSPIFPDRGDKLDQETIKLISDVAHITAVPLCTERKQPKQAPIKFLEIAGIAAGAHAMEPEDEKRGRRPTRHTEPDPRGGELEDPTKREKKKKKRVAVVKKKRGRPPGSLNKIPARGRKKALESSVEPTGIVDTG